MQTKNTFATLQSCEDKLQQGANTFKDMGKAMKAIGIVGKIGQELKDSQSIAGIAVKMGIHNWNKNKGVSAMQIINTCKEQLKDGWKELSPELTKTILTF